MTTARSLLGSTAVAAIVINAHAALPPVLAAHLSWYADPRWYASSVMAAFALCLGAAGRSWKVRLPAALASAVIATLNVLLLASLWVQGEGLNAAFWWHFRLSTAPIALAAFPYETAVGLGYVALALALPLVFRTRVFSPYLAGPALLVAVAAFPPAVQLKRLVVARATVQPERVLRAVQERQTAGVPKKQPPTKRNLVMIYLESLERTYFDRNLFGDLVPNLRRIAERGVEFTNLRQVPGTQNTIAGLVATQCGFPLASTIQPAEIFSSLGFSLPGTCLARLLSSSGYQTVYLGGARSTFAGKGEFLSQSGYRQVLGREQLQDQLSDADYVTGWGLYDDSLLEIAFARFQGLAAAGTPFLLTLLTLDTHYPVGHPSRRCQSLPRQANSMLDAVHCTDHLVAQFIEEIRNSPAGPNTLVVIASDHLAMRNTAWLMLSARADQRRLTLILDAPWLEQGRIEREGSHFDEAPTILDLLGFEEYGDFPLGQSLLSNEQGFLADQALTDSDLASLDVVSLWSTKPTLPAELELDATERRMRIGRHWIALDRGGGRPLPDRWVVALLFDQAGTLQQIESLPDARKLLLHAGEFAVAFAPTGTSLRSLAVTDVADSRPLFGLGRIGTADFRVMPARGTVWLTVEEVQQLWNGGQSGGPPGAAPPPEPNAVQVLVDRDEVFPAALEMVRSAKEEILVSMYLFGGMTDAEGRPGIGKRLVDEMAARARAGVRVRILNQPFRALPDRRRVRVPGDPWFEPVFEYARRAGLAVLAPDVGRGGVDHTKYLVVDGREALFGGMNLDEAVASNHDLMLRVAGPLVAGLKDLFATSWRYAVARASRADNPPPADIADHRRLAFVDAPALRARVRSHLAAGWHACGASLFRNTPDERTIRAALVEHLRAAGSGDRLDVALALLTDDALIEALVDARRRGVAVRVLLDPQEAYFAVDCQGAYNWKAAVRLHDADVEVRHFDAAPGQELHMKLFLLRRASGKASFGLGSSNWTPNAMTKNWEAYAVWEGCPAAAERIARMFESDWTGRSRPISDATIARQRGADAQRVLRAQCARERKDHSFHTPIR